MQESRKETVVIAIYTQRHDAEIAKSYLEDRGISSFIIADDVHVSLQLTDGVKLVAMQHQAEKAVDALSEVDLMPEAAAAAVDFESFKVDPEAIDQPDHPDEEWDMFEGLKRGDVIAATAATLLLVLLFFVPWRVEGLDHIMWAPMYRPPISQVGLQTIYETGQIAYDLLVLQLLGISALGWIGTRLAGAASRNRAANGK